MPRTKATDKVLTVPEHVRNPLRPRLLLVALPYDEGIRDDYADNPLLVSEHLRVR